MRVKVKKHFDQVLSHPYINPLEKCNLRCKICYTRKTDPILTEKEILAFIDRYKKVKKIETITFCGGEVFALQYFPGLVNKITESMHFSDSATAFSEGPAACVSQTSLQNRPNLRRDSRPVKLRLGVPLSRHPLRITYSKGIFVQIITNGTVDKLDEFKNPNMINLIVSIDGLRDYHDKNRGEGNFDKSIMFLLKARSLGFHTEIFSIVTRQNIGRIEEFEKNINRIVSNSSTLPAQAGIGGVMASPDNHRDQPATPEVSLPLSKQTVIPITYHPRKSPAYLMHHPISNIRGITDGFDFLDANELITLVKERQTFPPKDIGCFQIALSSDRKVYGCCEGTVPIGKIDDKIEDLFDRLEARLEIWEKKNPPAGGLGKCLGCSQPDFVCGLKNIIAHI